MTTEYIQTSTCEELRVFSHNKLVATITIGLDNGFIDYDNELSLETFNLMQIDEKGNVVNEEPQKI